MVPWFNGVLGDEIGRQMIVEIAGFHGNNYKSALLPLSSTPTLFIIIISVCSTKYMTGRVIIAVAAKVPMLRSK